MKKLLFLVFVFLTSTLAAQNGLPIGLTPQEVADIPAYTASRAAAAGGFVTPPTMPVRTMAEWEEIEYLVVTWTQYPTTVREIIRYAIEEAEVLVICSDSNTVLNSLNSAGIPTNRVHFVLSDFDTVWLRDYAANTVYKNEIDSVAFVDWIYNRPRPSDDTIPLRLSKILDYDLYSATVAPYDIVHTGGNFHIDGFGTAFSSELVLEENDFGGQFNTTVRDKVGVDSIMQQFMGITRNITMPTLPYDGIHHIDMHMRLLDEETLLVGEYPQGVADGPQIEANLQYILSNYNSVWGTPYRVVRIEMPPDGSNQYPDDGPWWDPGDYRTYTNNVFVNKTLLVPVYEERYDSTALRILEESLPGYKVVGINCNQIIQAGGALHCITRAIGAQQPLLIAHQRLRDTNDPVNDYTVDAWIRHTSGIASANLFYSTDTSQGFTAIPMTLTNAATDTWSADIPAQPYGTRIHYHIQALSNSGKMQVRPMPAPQGNWEFDVLQPVAIDDELAMGIAMNAVYPNPAGAITCIPVQADREFEGKLSLFNVMGQEIKVVTQGAFPAGASNHFFFANELAAGSYLLVLEGEGIRDVQRVMVK